MLTVKLIVERLDKEGRLLDRREQPSRSFTKGFLELLYVAHAQIPNGSPYSMTNIDGAAKNVDGTSSTYTRYSKENLRIGAPAGDAQVICLAGQKLDDSADILANTIVASKIGIQVGTGDVAVTPTDTALSARIAHGRGAGELEYGGCELIGIAFVNPNGEFTIRRYFTNASGGSITVNEVGIYAVGTYAPTSSFYSNSFLIARDVVAPGVAVADTEILRVTYVPQITV